MTREPVEDLPGYEVGDLLHDSGTSAVYRARRLSDGARVVVKRTHGSAVSVRQLTRYRNEHELLRSLDSPGVVKVHELLRHQGQLALVLEEFAGVPLTDWIATARPTLGARLDAAISLTTALGEVHTAGLIHKDVNSHNALYEAATQRVKLIDFGIATRLRSEDGKRQFPAALEGTLAYIAPEQTARMNRSVDYRADFYSLGITLYELFSGRLPYTSDDPLECVHFHIAGKPQPLVELDPKIPQALSDVVAKLLRKAPEDRYQSAAGVAADLRRCAAELAATGKVEAFTVGTADVVDRFEPPQKLYGRRNEVAELLETFERIADGGVETVLVSGGPGIGKTSLVQEIYQPMTRRRAYFATGKYEQLRQDTPFSALVDAFQDLVRQLLTESEESIGRWRNAIRDAVGINGQVIVDVIPALELIIGPQPKAPVLPGFEAQNRFKLVFQSFIQVFAKRSHPLVLFLDDMQWADAASLNLVTLILSAPATESLLVVQAYRHNEVSSTDPFMLAVKEQGNRGVEVGSIALAPLGSRDIAQFLADALREEPAKAMPLAEIIYGKTGGNPFFIRQFVKAMYTEKLISFDREKGVFRYDVDGIRAAAITENVAEFLASKLGRFAVQTRIALCVAAAIGNRFDLRTVAVVSRCTEGEAAERLEPASSDGLVVPASELESLDPSALESPLVYRHFAFLHDRVQQAAYEMIAPENRPALHLAIGRAILAQGEPEHVEQRLFDIVNHLNQGAALIRDPEERLRLAEFNLRAGIKARNSTAYSIAVHCYRNAIALLAANAWTDNYALVFEAHVRLAEALCLIADYAAAFRLIDETLLHAASVTDRAKLHALKVITHLSMGQMPDALACGRRAAEEFGIELPDDAARAGSMLQTEIGAILGKTAEIGDSLLELPAMDEPARIALMELLTHCLPAAYQTNQELFALICCKMVSQSIEHGNCPLSARAYGSFGALLSGAMGRHRDAYRFTKLGVDLAHRFNDPSVYSGVYFLWAMFASHWVEPITQSIELFKQSIEYGLQTGDHLHAGYSAARRVSHQEFNGMPLAELHEEAINAFQLLERISDFTNIEFLAPRMRYISWLRGERPHGHTLGTDTQSEQQCTEAIRARGNRSFEADWFMLLAKQRYLCGDVNRAYELCQEAERLLPFSAAFITRSEHSFYYALTAARRHDEAEAPERADLERLVAARHEELKTWAADYAPNFAHMELLVAAELARVRGATLEAIELYDRAVAAAADHGCTHIEALAAELAARFWHARGKPAFGTVYLEKALHAYEIWGAFGRVADLRAAHGVNAPHKAAQSVTTSPATAGSVREQSDALDFATVLKASQALASEIVLDRLLAKMMDIILENAGAERVVLVLQSQDGFLVQGIKESKASEARVMLGEPLARADALSQGIANYVIRTAEHVVLADPALRGNFSNDAYVRSRGPKSVLCAPIVHKGTLTGVLYLENNQVAGAFTPDRLEALNVLMAQVAVSIENATLYAQREQQARSIELANAALTNEVGERKRAEEELSRYKDHLEDIVAKRTRELESAQGRLVDLSRRAGMAEVASGVLHNVGNVMNSINVGANIARDAVRALPVERVESVCALLDENAERLGEYFSADSAGRKVPEYLRKLGQTLATEKQNIRAEIDRVVEHLEHMKKVIAAQQSYARVNGMKEICTLQEIVETSISINEAGLRKHRIEVVREYADLGSVLVDRHGIIQILINLISNAKDALTAKDPGDRVLTIAIGEQDDKLRVEVRDNGIGIPPENLAKIFNHGFTTKTTGHGFGLHNCANAAQAMDGSLEAFSAGPGRGATLVLSVPARYADGAQRAGAA
jgi:predicted ATPase/signal transduction histidine kinase